MRNLSTILQTIALSCLLLSVSGEVLAASMPQARGQIIRDFARLTFEWPEPTLFTAKTSGNNVILTFDRKANPNMAAILKDLNPYITKAERKSDGKTIVLTLNKPYRIRTFVSDNVSGIDVLGIDKSKQKNAATIAAKAPAKETVKPQTAKAQPAIKKPITVAVKKPVDDARQFALLAPAAGEPEPPAVVDANKPKEEASAPLATPPVVATSSKPVSPDTSAKSADTATVTANPASEPLNTALPPSQAKEVAISPPSPPPPSDNMPKPPVEPQAVAPATVAEPAPQAVAVQAQPLAPAQPVNPVAEDGAGVSTISRRAMDAGSSMVPMELPADVVTEETKTEETKKEDASAPISQVESSQDLGQEEPQAQNKLIVSSDDSSATIRLPLLQRTALSIFVRQNVLWVVAGEKLDWDLSDFDSLKGGIVHKAAFVPNDKATVLRINIDENIYPKLKQTEGKAEVAILLSAKKSDIATPLDVSISTEPPAPAHVFLPALETGEVVAITDPVIGDNLLVAPVFMFEQGVAKSRNFVEFSLLESIQGVVVAKKSDETEITPLRNGLRISVPQGAQLSPFAFDQTQANNVILSSSETLFPHELWSLEPNRSLKLTTDKLIHTTVFGANDGDKNLARLRLAQLYLNDGYAPEALGFLDNIKRTNPSYYRSAKLAAMRGVSNFLMYRFSDAARDFASAELNNNIEVDFWRNTIADLLGSPNKSTDYMAMSEMYINKYPPIFRQRLAIVAADRAIAAKQPNVALKIFDVLDKDKIIEPIQPYVDFLKARIAADNGQEQEAIAVWDRLAKESPNKFVQARAEFSRTLWQLDNNTITRDNVIDRFERLRLSWHGDGLELQVIQILGDLYAEQKDYVNAMRIWQVAVTGFRNTGPAVEMEAKMQDTFTKLFGDGIADAMPPIQALALYYEYRNFMPPGPAGAQMIEKLSDRLIAVDLLSSSAQLLEQQMRTQLEKEERSRIGTKLASIYLMNNQPKRAMKALQESVYGENSILMRIQRNQIAAEAMMKLGKPAEALATLGQDESPRAEKIRAMIYWKDKNWPSVITSVENMLKKRADPSQQLTQEESEFVLRLALSYVFENDKAQLQYLRDYFLPLLQNNPNQMAFDFITAPDIQPNTRNFDELLEALSKTRSFINGYEAKVTLADAGNVSNVPEKP